MPDRVSVIMATYNTRKEYLDDSIKSMLSQTYNNIELVIVCDGCEDEYSYICSSFKDERIKVLLNDKNRGLPYSLNRAVKESSGEFIARMDSDDISLPTRIEEELNYLKKNKLDICGTSAYLFGNENGKKRLVFNSVDDIMVQLLFRATLIHPTVIGKKSVFIDNKYDEKYKDAEDFELWSRLSNNYKIGIYDKCLLRYRVHGKQISVKKGNIQRDLSRKIIRKNTSYVTGEFNEGIFDCLWMLSGREKITKTNYRRFSELIDYVIKENSKYNNYSTRSLKRVFYNRFFELLLKNKIIVGDFCSIKKIVKMYNLCDIVCFSLNKLWSHRPKGKDA